MNERENEGGERKSRGRDDRGSIGEAREGGEMLWGKEKEGVAWEGGGGRKRAVGGEGRG